MESSLARPVHPLRKALARILVVGNTLGLAWTAFAHADTWPYDSQRVVLILLWTGMLLGTGSSLLGDRYPRWRWALLLASCAVLILVFVFQIQLLKP